MSGEEMHARFQASKSRLYVSVRFHDAYVSLSWPHKGPEHERHLRTILSNIDYFILRGRDDLLVKREMFDFDTEWIDLNRKLDQDKGDQA